MTYDYYCDYLDDLYNELEKIVTETNRKVWPDGGDDDKKRYEALCKALNSLGDALYYMQEANGEHGED